MTGLRVGFAVDNGIRAFCLGRSVAKGGFLLGTGREVSRSADAISPPERSFFVAGVSGVKSRRFRFFLLKVGAAVLPGWKLWRKSVRGGVHAVVSRFN